MFDLIEGTFHLKLFWISVFFVLFYLYMKKIVYTYWTRHGIPQEDATVPIGTLGVDYLMRKKNLAALFENSYKKFKKYPYHGFYIFYKRALMINDPELIKHILVKDFVNFCHRGIYYNPELDPLTAHLFLTSGEQWKTLRTKLTPTFTSGKLKRMFPTVKSIAENMMEVVDENLLTTDIIEMKDIFARYTTDMIFNLNCFWRSGEILLELSESKALEYLYTGCSDTISLYRHRIFYQTKSMNMFIQTR